MMTTSSLQAGSNGMQNGMSQFQKSAERIASQSIQEKGTDLSDMAKAQVDMIAAEQQVTASAKVVKASDGMIGSLIDVMV